MASILSPVHAVVKHPEALSFVEAASVWMMFLTAYGALIFDAQVKAGDFVIIPAASSSVGLAAIQLANYAGATPIALTRTSEKKKRLHEAGAAHVIATQEQDMLAEVMRITNGNGARVAFDPVGGPAFPKLISVLEMMTTEPIRVAACHCKECQRQSGSAFGMSMSVKKDSLTVTGLTKQFARVADIGIEVTGVFCPECGVRIYHVLASAPDVVSIKPGTLDDTHWLRPGSFIWMKSAQGWGPVPDDVKALERQT
jgi:hypothetical protein